MKLNNKDDSIIVESDCKVQSIKYGEDHSVRTVKVEYQGTPSYFMVGYDLNSILGYKNPSSLVNKLDKKYRFNLPVKRGLSKVLLSPKGVQELLNHAKRRPNVNELAEWYNNTMKRLNGIHQPVVQSVHPIEDDNVLEPQTFDYMNTKVRFIRVANKNYAVGIDVAKAIGYTNPQKAVKDHVKDKYQRGERIVTPSGSQVTTLISEPGIYQLAIQSELPNAEPFQDWVLEKVIPQIMHTGSYQSAPAMPTPSFPIDDLDERHKQWLKEEDVRREQIKTLFLQAKTIQTKDKQIEQMSDSYNVGEYLKESVNSYSMKEAANIIGDYCGMPNLGRSNFMRLMRMNGQLSKAKSTWNKPLQKAVNAGYLKYHRSYYTDQYGHKHTDFVTEITAKGMHYYMPRFKQWGETMVWTDDIPETADEPSYHSMNLLDRPEGQ